MMRFIARVSRVRNLPSAFTVGAGDPAYVVDTTKIPHGTDFYSASA